MRNPLTRDTLRVSEWTALASASRRVRGLYVEQDSQKPIVIGRGGEMIKRIGTEARQDLERFFETKVFLDLRVKVNPNWRNDAGALDDIGVPRSTQKARRRGR